MAANGEKYDDRAISKAIREDRYKDAIALIRAAQKKEPNSHWLWACLSTCYYEQHQYRLAVRFAHNAVKIAPNCPLSLWYYGSSLDAYGRGTIGKKSERQWAITTSEKVFKGLLAFGWKYLAFLDPCGEGEAQAKALLNDSRYRLGLLYWHCKDYKAARRWMKLHLRMRTAGQKSIYTKTTILRDLKQLEQEMGNVKS